MTEQEWLQATDPEPRLEFLRGKASDRKLRLFGCACCRRIWHLFPYERSRRAVEIAELFADGLLSAVEAKHAGDAAAKITGNDFHDVPHEMAGPAVRAAEILLPLAEHSGKIKLVWKEVATKLVWELVATALEGELLINEGAYPDQLSAWSEQCMESGRTMGWTAINPDAIIADILREVVGNPFCPVSLNPAWLTWNDGTVVKLAQAIYDDRAFDRLLILADALEESGCTNLDILNHCRQPGEHVRGCWVVDLLLGKE